MTGCVLTLPVMLSVPSPNNSKIKKVCISSILPVGLTGTTGTVSTSLALIGANIHTSDT